MSVTLTNGEAYHLIKTLEMAMQGGDLDSRIGKEIEMIERELGEHL
jgi:hypothetical protein